MKSLEEIEKLLSETTPGKWWLEGTGIEAIVRGGDGRIVSVRHRLPSGEHYPNAKFIAQSKEIIEDLMRMVKAYREVAIQNSYQGVNISDESVCKLIDSEANRLMEESK